MTSYRSTFECWFFYKLPLSPRPLKNIRFSLNINKRFTVTLTCNIFLIEQGFYLKLNLKCSAWFQCGFMYALGKCFSLEHKSGLTPYTEYFFRMGFRAKFINLGVSDNSYLIFIFIKTFIWVSVLAVMGFSSCLLYNTFRLV